MTARKSHSRFRASGSGHDSLTPTAGRKRSAAQRVLVANAARVAEAAQTAAAQDRPRVSAYGLDGGTPEDDTAYEFVAPKFHDFLGADADMDGADEWFGGIAATLASPDAVKLIHESFCRYEGGLAVGTRRAAWCS